MGCLKIWILDDGFLAVKRDPDTSLFEKFRSIKLNEIKLGVHPVLVEIDGVRFLIDCGKGDKFSSNQFGKYSFEKSFSIRESLVNNGIDPDSISCVINTHLHFDHCGGNTFYEDGELEPSFPSARYFVQEREYNYAIKRAPFTNSYLMENFEPLEDSGVLEIIDGDFPIGDDIKLRFCGGHTPGLMIVTLTYRGRNYHFTSDLVPTRHHIRLNSPAGVDVDPEQLKIFKDQFLEKISNGDDLLFFYHAPQPECGVVIKKGDKYIYRREDIESNPFIETFE